MNIWISFIGEDGKEYFGPGPTDFEKISIDFRSGIILFHPKDHRKMHTKVSLSGARWIDIYDKEECSEPNTDNGVHDRSDQK